MAKKDTEIFPDWLSTINLPPIEDLDPDDESIFGSFDCFDRNRWIDRSTTYPLQDFTSIEDYYMWHDTAATSFALTGDEKKYIDYLNRLFQIMQDGEHGWGWIKSEEEMQKQISLKNGYNLSNSRSLKDMAHEYWQHENTHIEVCNKYNLQARIAYGYIEIGNGLRHQVFIAYDINELRERSQNERPGFLMKFIADSYLAPDKIGVGYEAETLRGTSLLAAWKKRYSK